METDLQYYTRRVVEELRAARRATTPEARRTHEQRATAFTLQMHRIENTPSLAGGPRSGWSPSCSPLEGTRLAPKGFADRLIACVAMGIIASPSRKPAFPIGEGAISTPLGRRAMDENKLQRSDARRVGKECVSACRSRWSPYH